MKLTTFLHLTFWLIIVSVSSLSAQNREIEKVFSKENSLKKIPIFYLPEVSDLLKNLLSASSLFPSTNFEAARKICS